MIRIDRQPVQRLQSLAGSAVLGLDRSGLPDSDSQAAFLQEFSVLSLYVQMGKMRTAEHATAFEVFDEEEKVCRPAAGRLLREILHGEYNGLLGEWCRLADQSQLKAPAEYLPDLLEYASQTEKERRTVLPVVGKRGAWLAGHNPAWKDLLTEHAAAEDTWQTGTLQERLNYFAGLRGENPQKARQLAQEAWPLEPPDNKASFLELFRVGLSVEDESFLEECLDDKRKPVRQTAAALLSCLPDSKLCKRMTERLFKLIRYQPGKKGLLLSKKPTLEIELPDIADKELLRDGADPRKIGSLGQKAVALSNIIASVPLNQWHTLESDLSSLLSGVFPCDFAAAILLGMATAAIRQQDQQWATTLIRNYPTIAEQMAAAGNLALDLEGLLNCLSCELKENLIIEFADKNSASKYLNTIYEFLSACNHPWSKHFSAFAFGILQQHYLRYLGNYHLRQPMIELFALRLAPDIADQAEKGWPIGSKQFTSGDEEMVRQLASILHLRQSMFKELCSEQ